MAANVTIEQAITGEERINDVRDPLFALSEFYRALNSRDLGLMQENWENGEDSAMDNPLGGIKRGWTEIKAVYQKLFQLHGAYHFEFFDYTRHTSSEIFYVVGRERGLVEKNGKRLDMKIRTTRVFRFDGRRWRQIHHHGSIDDAQLLANYQAVVIGS